jgi:glycogen synthase
MRAMRVLAVGNMYPPHHLGGYELCWQGAMAHLRGSGHGALVLTTDYRRPDAVADESDAHEPDVHRELRWYWEDHGWPEMSPLARLGLERHNAAAFDRQIREFEPDLVTWWSVGGMSLGLIERARRAAIPALLFVHDYWPSYGPERDLWTRMWRWRPRRGALVQSLTGLPTRPDLPAAGRWLFNSQSMREQTLATGLRIDDSAILAPGIDRSYLLAPREPEAPPWRWRLLYIGRVVEQKGVRTAIESLPLLAPQASLQIVGDGDAGYRRELDQTARSLGVRDRVEFSGARAREELFDTYRAADVVIFPVQWPEPFGLVPLEAMALGRPVVATGRGGSGDYLEHGGNALLFEAGNAGKLAATLQTVAADPGLRNRLRRGGYETAAAHGEDEFNRRALDEMLAAARAPAARARR